MSNVPKSMKDAVIVLSDYQGGTEKITVTCEDGDFSYTLPDTAEHVPDRGAPGSLIDGAFEPITWSMTVQMKEMTGSVGIQDVVTCTAGGAWNFSLMDDSTGDYSALTLTAGTDTLASASAPVFQMVVTITDPADSGTETLYFANCTAQVSFQEGMPNRFTISGRSFMTASAFMSSIATA